MYHSLPLRRLTLSLPALIFSIGLYAQWVPLNNFSLDQEVEWQQGTFHNGQFIGMASENDKQFLVQGTSAGFLTQLLYNRFASNGSELLILDADGNLQDRVVDIANRSLTDPILIYGRGTNPNRSVQLHDVLPPTGILQALYSSKTNLLSASDYPNHGMAGPFRGFPRFSDVAYYGRGYEFAVSTSIISLPSGLARSGTNFIGVSRIPGFDRTQGTSPAPFSHGWSVYDTAGNKLNSLHFELRGEVLKVIGYQNGYLLATDREILVTDNLGEPLRVFSLPAQVELIDASANDDSSGLVAVLNTPTGNVLAHATADAGFDSVFEPTDTSSSIQHIYYDSNLGYRIEGTCGNTLCFGNIDGALSDASIITQQSINNLRFPLMISYPFPDTIGGEIRQGHAEFYVGTLDYPVLVDYTVDSNVYIQIRGEREIRSKSGQLLQIVSQAPALDTNELTFPWEDRLRIVDGSVVMDKVDGTVDSLFLEIPWNGSSGTRTVSTSALPNGQLIARRQTSFFRGNPSIDHWILDTLGNIQTNLGGDEVGFYAKPQGLLLYGKRSYGNRYTSATSTRLAYSVVPYALLRRPVDLPFTIPFCTEDDLVSYTNPLTGVLETQILSSANNIMINGINFELDRPEPALLANVIDTIIIEAFCSAATQPRQFEVLLNDPAAVASIFADGVPLDDFEYIDDRSIELTLTDTNGCVVTRRVTPERDQFRIFANSACFNDDDGSLSGTEGSVIIDGITHQLPYENLRAGSYPLQFNSAISGCSLDTTMIIEESAEILLDTSIQFLGSQVQFNASLRDTTLPIPAFFTWSTGETTSSIIVSLGDTATLTTRYRGCERVDTFIARRTSSTVGVNMLSAQVYPNPARTELTIEIASSATGTIVNRLGQSLQAFSLEPGTNTIRIDKLPTGLYHLRLEHDRSYHSSTFVKLE